MMRGCGFERWLGRFGDWKLCRKPLEQLMPMMRGWQTYKNPGATDADERWLAWCLETLQKTP